MRIDSQKPDRAVLSFTHLGGGLASNSKGEVTSPLQDFTIAGEDRKFVNAQAEIQGDHIIVWSPQVAKPVAVRYGCPAQQAALDQLATEQVDRSSPNFHHWVTAQEFGEKYGPAQQDIDVITKWLQRHGFQVNNVAAGRTTIDFSGTVAQVQTAFHTSIRQYRVNNEQHWANSTDPAIPTALVPVVAGIRSLHNFHPKPSAHLRRQTSVRSAFTFNNGGPCDVPQDSNNCFAVGPGDFTTIYNVQPLYNNNITGSGVTIGIVADSDINLTDVSQFRALFNLPANIPNVIYPTGSSPGKNNDEIEAVLDTEWSGAVATGATIDLVTAPSSNSTFGGDTAANYIINCQVAGRVAPMGLCRPAY